MYNLFLEKSQSNNQRVLLIILDLREPFYHGIGLDLSLVFKAINLKWIKFSFKGTILLMRNEFRFKGLFRDKTFLNTIFVVKIQIF